MIADDKLQVLEVRAGSNLCHLQATNLLSYDRKPMRFQRVDKFLFLLANISAKKHQRICFLYPVAKREIMLPLAVDLLYTLDGEGHRSKLLLYTDLIRYRYLYPELATQYMRFNDIFPVGIVKPDGGVKAVKKTSDCSTLREVVPKLIITNSPDLLPSQPVASDVGCLLVDLNSVESFREAEELITFADRNDIGSVIFFGTDIDSPILQVVTDKGIKIWSWNEDMLRKEIQSDMDLFKQKPECFDNPFSGSITHIINLIEGVERIFMQIEDPNVGPLLQQARAYYLKLRDYAKEHNSDVVKRVATRFIGTIYAFERMTAPLSITDQECKASFLALTFEERIRRVRGLIDKVKNADPLVGSAITEAIDRLELIQSEFARHDLHGKAQRLLEIAAQARERSKRILVLAPSQPYRRSTEKFLGGKLGMTPEQMRANGIHVVSTDMPLPSDRFDVCVFYGQAPYDQMHLLKITCAKKIVFLCYSTEGEILRYQVQHEVKGVNSRVNKEARLSALQTLLPDMNAEWMDDISGTDAGMPEMTTQFSDRSPESNNLFSSLLEEETALQEDELFSEDEDGEEEIAGGNLVTTAIEFTFVDGQKLYCRAKRHLPILTGEKVNYKEARMARIGERVLLVKNDLRRSMADTLLKASESHPRLAYLNLLAQSWTHALKQGMKEHQMNDAEMLEELQKRGSDLITPIAIYFWRMGYVIAPRDPKDLQRIGHAVGEQTLIGNYKEVFQAAQRIRSIHIKLLRRINQAVIISQNAGESDTDDVIDEEFGLHAEDFMKMISVHQIKFIREDVKVSAGKLDRLTK